MWFQHTASQAGRRLARCSGRRCEGAVGTLHSVWKQPQPQRRWLGRGRWDDDMHLDHDDSQQEHFELKPTSIYYLDEETAERRRLKIQQRGVKEEYDFRTGRGWTDRWDMGDDSPLIGKKYRDVPDWTPDMTSRVSMERVKIHPDGILTLEALAALPLPPPPPPHPGHGDGKKYATQRKRYLYDKVCKQVAELAEHEVPRILRLPIWHDKQDAVDALFESVELQLKDKEPVMGLHPHFGTWVERALEEHLKRVEQKLRLGEDIEPEVLEGQRAERAQDALALPIFMDLFDEADGEVGEVPKILHPLQPHPRDGPGRMVEEWELSAHKTTKRILLRQCTRQIARILESSESPRILVTGRRGAGKTAAMAAIVASARKSGHLVLYLPDGDRLRKLGYYIEPNARRKGFYDLPMLAQEICSALLMSHEGDLEGFTATPEVISMFFTDAQIEKIPTESKDAIPLAELLRIGQEHTALAAMCYSVVIHCLVNQTTKPFLMVLDEFNCYFDKGQYFHMDYDPDVVKSIPYDKISLFQPFIDAMGLPLPKYGKHEEQEPVGLPLASIKRGGILVGLTESRAISRLCTDGVTELARQTATVSSDTGVAPVHIVDVPRYSTLEVEHVVANFEATGIGRLRFDRGDTVLDEQEVVYLRMISGGFGQNLLDSCIL